MIPLHAPDSIPSGRGLSGWTEKNTKLDDCGNWIRRTNWEAVVREANALGDHLMRPEVYCGHPFASPTVSASLRDVRAAGNDSRDESSSAATAVGFSAVGAVFITLKELLARYRAISNAPEASSARISRGPPGEPSLKPRRAANQGLLNFGNSCFISAVHQLLFHCNRFKGTLCEAVKRARTLDPRKLAASQFAAFLSNSLAAMSHATSALDVSQVRSFLPDSFFSSDRRVLRQQDAREYYGWIESSLDSIFDAGTTPQKSFRGQWTRKIRCRTLSCISADKIETFSSILITADRIQALLHDLDKLLSEALSTPITRSCSHCEADVEESLQIDTFPSILLVSIQREWQESAEDAPRRIDSAVHFRQAITILDGSNSAKYRLFAILNHQGSISSGHWTAICRSSSASEYEPFSLFNDCQEPLQVDFERVVQLSRHQCAMLAFARLDE